MQKQACKLLSRVALVVAVAQFALPCTIHANGWHQNMRYMCMLGGAWNKSDFRKITVKNIAQTIKSASDVSQVGLNEVSVVGNGFLGALDGSLSVHTVYQFTDMFSAGISLGLGISSNTIKIEKWQSLSISEPFVGKLGIALGVTDWVLLSIGGRFSYLSMNVDWTNDDKTAIAALKNGLQYNTGSSANKQNWMFGAYLDVNVLIPISDYLKFVGTIGIFADMTETKFNGLCKATKLVESGGQAQVGSDARATDKASSNPWFTEETKVEIDNAETGAILDVNPLLQTGRIGMKGGFGLLVEL